MSESASPTVEWEGKYLRILKQGRWEYAERIHGTGAVVIAAVTGDGNLLLTEQIRPPVSNRVIELPAGIAGDIKAQETENLAVAARRELLEETGYEARAMEFLTCGPPSAGLSSEVVTFFRASELRRVGDGGGIEHEEIQVHEVPLGSVQEWLEKRRKEGVLVDPKVYVGLHFLSL